MHVLQRKAKPTKLKETSTPPDAIYDFASGVWRSNGALITYDTQNGMMTKKNDLETGEDQKGQ